MLEVVVKKIKAKDYDKTVFVHALIGFYLTKKEEQNNRLLLTFVRDLDGNSINKYIQRAKQYFKYSIPSIIPTIIFTIVAFILLTLFIVLTLINKKDGISLINIVALLLPGILSFLLGAIYTIYRTKKIGDYIDKGSLEKENIRKEVLKEIDDNRAKIFN